MTDDPRPGRTQAASPDLIVVGGGIAGSAAVLRAAQYGLRVVWLRGSARTAKASRGRYVRNVDNMLGVHSDIVLEKVRGALQGDQHAAARAALDGAHFHIGTADLVRNAAERARREAPDRLVVVDEAAVAARRVGAGFEVEAASGARFGAPAVVLATGVSDRQPRIRQELPDGRVLDDIRWVFPFANQERFLYCIRCEGHMTRGTPTAVIGASESAAQIALMLHERYGGPVHLLTNGEALAAGGETRALLAAYGVQVHDARIARLEDRPPGSEVEAPRPKGSDLHALVLEDGARVPARFALVALGLHRVHNDLARALGAELEAGAAPDEERHVLIEDASAETSVPGLFAIGDLARRRDGGPLMKQVYTAQEYAVRAVDAIERRARRARRRAALAARA